MKILWNKNPLRVIIELDAHENGFKELIERITRSK